MIGPGCLRLNIVVRYIRASPAHHHGHGATAASGLNPMRRDALSAARHVSTAERQAIDDVLIGVMCGVFQSGDVDGLNEDEDPKRLANAELVASALADALRRAFVETSPPSASGYVLRWAG